MCLKIKLPNPKNPKKGLGCFDESLYWEFGTLPSVRLLARCISSVQGKHELCRVLIFCTLANNCLPTIFSFTRQTFFSHSLANTFLFLFSSPFSCFISFAHYLFSFFYVTFFTSFLHYFFIFFFLPLHFPL